MTFSMIYDITLFLPILSFIENVIGSFSAKIGFYFMKFNYYSSFTAFSYNVF